MDELSFGRGLSRRAVIAGAAGLAAALPLRRARAAVTPLTVRLDWSTHGVHAPFFLAEKKGWFKAADLEIAMQDGNGSATTAALVGSGQFDVGHAALAPMALGKAKGLSVISTACFVRKGDTGIIVPRESGWTKPADMMGKKLVYTAGSLEGPFMAPFFARNNVPADKLNLLNVEASAKVSLYMSGNADACVSTVPFVVAAVSEKRPSTGILFADFGMNLPGFGLVVNTDSLARKGEAVRRFTSVICAAWTYILNGHEQEGIDAILTARPQSPVPGPLMLAEIRGYRPYFATAASKDLPIGPQTDAEWVGTIADMSGTLPPGSKPSDFYTNDYIDLGMVKKVAASG